MCSTGEVRPAAGPDLVVAVCQGLVDCGGAGRRRSRDHPLLETRRALYGQHQVRSIQSSHAQLDVVEYAAVRSLRVGEEAADAAIFTPSKPIVPCMVKNISQNLQHGCVQLSLRSLLLSFWEIDKSSGSRRDYDLPPLELSHALHDVNT